MLLPTQQSLGLVATGTMQSMLDGIEEQRKQDEEKRTGRERDKITEARLSASEEAKRAREKIASALFGTSTADPAALKLDLIERLGKELGIDTDEAHSSYRLGKALEDALKTMQPDEVRALSEKIGFDDLDLSMDTLLAAIKNPYGDDNERLKEALIRKANGGKLDMEVARVVQRLEDTADPKTLEELKLGPQGYDPTRVEDAATRAERLDDIAAAEAGEKLEDVQKTQDVIEKTNEVAKDAAASSGEATVDADGMLTLMAAAAEQVDSGTEGGNSEMAADAGGDMLEAAVTDDALKSAEGEQTVDEIVGEMATEELALAIVPVHVDEIGLYELLKKKIAA